MSDVLLPTLAGLSWDTTKAPELNTQIQRSVSLSELRTSFTSTPVWHFTRSYDVLRETTGNTELKSLGGFFLARYGAWDSWLFADPDDSVALLESFGTGDGVTTAFQLRRAFGVFSESCKNVAAAPLIYKNSVLQTVTTHYTVSSTGLVTFVAAPTNGHALTWSGTYYFRCRWEKDVQEYAQFMRQLWEAKSVDFIGSLGRQI